MTQAQLRAHLNFIHGFNAMTRGINAFMTLPVLPFYMLLMMTERGKAWAERGVMFFPTLFLTVALFPVVFIAALFEARFALNLLKNLRDGVLPFLSLLPLYIVSAILQIPALIINYTLSGIVWLGAQFMSLFGAAPRAGFKEFFNESFWLNEYGDLNYLDGQKISPVLDMAPGANLVPGTPVPPAEAAPGEPEGTLEADSTRSFSPAYESAVSHLDDSADDRGLNVDREASSFDVFYTGRRPHFD